MSRYMKKLSKKLKHEIKDPKSNLRVALYRDGVLRRKALPLAATLATGVPYLGPALHGLNAISQVADAVGYGRKRATLKKHHSKKRHTKRK